MHVPISECKAWFDELCARALRIQEEKRARGEKVDEAAVKEISDMLHAESDGEKPDWDGWFLYPPLTWQYKVDKSYAKSRRRKGGK